MSLRGEAWASDNGPDHLNPNSTPTLLALGLHRQAGTRLGPGMDETEMPVGGC
jgi:hypothetical protein